MIRLLALALMVLASPALAQTITVPTAFGDSNADCRIDFGSANRMKYGVPYVLCREQTVEKAIKLNADGTATYCGPKDCDPEPVVKVEQVEPSPPLPPVGVPAVASRYNSNGQPKSVAASWQGMTFGPANVAGNYGIWKNDGVALRGWHVHDLKIGYAWLTDVYKSGSWSDSTFERIAVDRGRAEGLIELSGRSSNVVISDIRFATTQVNTVRGKIYAGIGLIGKGAKDKGDNILIRRVDISGMKAKHGGYPNADGISTEAGYSNVRYEDVRVSGSSDGGIDTKAWPATCARVWLENNSRNFRIWNGIECDGPVWSVNPWTYHIQLMPKADGSSVFRFRHVTFRSKGKQPLIAIDGAYAGRKAKVIVERCTIDVPKGTPRVLDAKKGLVVIWGEGC